MRYTGDRNYDQLNLLEKAVVRHGHPTAFLVHMIGLMWGGYFLWAHQLFMAIGSFVFIIGTGEVVGWMDKDYLREARSGLNIFQQILVYHTDSRNLLFHGIGFICYVYGTWNSSIPGLLLAVSLVLLGHIFPWNEHRRLTGLRTLATDEENKIV